MGFKLKKRVLGMEKGRRGKRDSIGGSGAERYAISARTSPKFLAIFSAWGEADSGNAVNCLLAFSISVHSVVGFSVSSRTLWEIRFAWIGSLPVQATPCHR